MIARLLLPLVLLATTTPAIDDYVGTWTGTSTCVGNHPACGDEIVVYRFVAVPEHPGRLCLYADKIVEGERVPMGALIFEHGEKTHAVSCEFRTSRVHGLWTYALREDSLIGTGVSLPGGEKFRDVRAIRVKDERGLPSAPPFEDYDE